MEKSEIRLLVFGNSGQVAQELRRLTKALGIAAQFLDRAKADLTQPEICAEWIAKTNATCVINAAAYTAVDAAETDLHTATLVNGAAPGAMATAAANKNLPFLHISTDYVFDGDGVTPWTEDATPNPQTVYGQTKLDGEKAIQAAGGMYVILRTAWVFSAFGGNFVKTMCRLGQSRSHLKVVDDQRGGPTPAADIANALMTIARRMNDGHGKPGLYHFAGTPSVSWAEFAGAIFSSQSKAPEIQPVPSSDYPTIAKRPMNSILDCAKIARDYGIDQPDWRVGLAQVLQELEIQA